MGRQVKVGTNGRYVPPCIAGEPKEPKPTELEGRLREQELGAAEAAAAEMESAVSPPQEGG